MSRKAEQTNDDGPGLWRLSAAASRAGMSTEAFERASRAGVIPVAVIRTSERMAYVRRAELETWLRGA
jgi:hypothetical protein